MVGDSSIVSGISTPPNTDGRTVLGQQAFQPASTDEAAPSSKLGRYADVTAEGLMNLPAGIGHAIYQDATHLGDTAEMLGSSAVLGAALKTVLPEGGPVGLVAGAAIGGYFLWQAGKPIGDAYAKAGDAQTMSQLRAAGVELGDAAGAFGVNSAISMGGYKIGAGVMGRVLASEPMDGFAETKYNAYNALNSKIDGFRSRLFGGGTPEAGAGDGAVSTAGTLGLASRIKLDGNGKASLLDSQRSAPEGTVTGALDPNQQMGVTLLAKTKGTPFLMDRYIKRIANGAAPLTDEQIIDKFGTDSSADAAVRKFVADNGLQIDSENAASGRFRLKGTVSQMENAFGVKLDNYEHPTGVQFRGRSGMISVDEGVAPHVKAVLGLDNRPQFHTNFIRQSDLAGAGAEPSSVAGSVDGAAGAKPKGFRSFTPEEVFKAYNTPDGLDGQGMTTGFLSLGGTMPEGWDDHLQQQGIDPKLFKYIDLNDTPPTPDPRGANGENALDGDIHKRGLPKATTVMVQAPNSDSGMPDGIDRMTFPQKGETQITHGSISWGMYEPGWTDQARAAMEDAGKRAALKGLTLTVASGDNGAGDGAPGKKPQVDIPAGLEHFTGVGGTALSVDANGNWSSEKTWSGEGATGGGVSLKTPRPDFQKGVNIPKNLGGGSFDGRGVPDVAGNADPRTGWTTFTDDGDQSIGGTSAAAPEKAVTAAKISQATGKPTGYWNPMLYKLGLGKAPVFNDITVGNNTDAGVKGYPAGPGWDASTGWGSINIGNYIDYMNKQASRHFATRELTQVPGYIKQSGPTPVWAMPYNSNQEQVEQ